MHHGHFSKHVLELVYTEYEVHRSIIRHCRPIQLIPPQNLVFLTLTGEVSLLTAHVLLDVGGLLRPW